MKFIVSYISETTITWGGYEIPVSGVIERDAISLFDSSSGYLINLLEWGEYPREAINFTDEITPISDDEDNESDSRVESSRQNIDPILPREAYDTGFGFINSVLLTTLEVDLPFSDIKKAEKILPLQIQDRLPFDPVAPHSVLHATNTPVDDLYRYFYTCIEEDSIRSIIEDLQKASIKTCSLHPEIYLGTSILSFLSAHDSETKFSLLIEQANEFLCLNYKNSTLFHARKVKMGEPSPYQNRQLEAQLQLSLAHNDTSHTEDTIQNNISIISLLDTSKDKIQLNFPLSYTNKDINLRSLVLNQTGNDQIPFEILTAGICSYFDIAAKDPSIPLKDYKLSKANYPNLRSGEFRYRAPLTELKKSLVHELVPFSLILIFGCLSMGLSIMSPIKQHSLDAMKSNAIAREALQGEYIPQGREIPVLEEKIYELENQLGDMSSVQSLSSIEWLHTLSVLMDKNLPLEIDSITITTTGMTFRGTVPDYPTSGRVSSLLESLKASDPVRFCEAQLKTDDIAIGVTGKQILGEIKLCE